VPRQFVVTDEVPLTPVGKIHKAELRERHLQGTEG
jgi:fatty-acyl-CoA synthase